MDLTKKEIKAIEKFAIACLDFKFTMERAKEKKQKNKPPKFPAGGVMVDRGEKTGDHSVEFIVGKGFRVPNEEVKIPEHVSEKVKDFIAEINHFARANKAERLEKVIALKTEDKNKLEAEIEEIRNRIKKLTECE